MGTATLIGKFHRLNGATFETTRLKSIGRKLKRGQKLDRTEDRGQLLAPVSGSDRQSAISVQLLAGLETNKKGLNQDIFDEKKKNFDWATRTTKCQSSFLRHLLPASCFQICRRKFFRMCLEELPVFVRFSRVTDL